jgi:hypothetical protein
MHQFTLPDSQKNILLGVYHKYFDYYSNTDLDCENDWTERCTTLRYTELGSNPPVEVTARAVCHYPDNFCKREGRRRAAMTLLRKLNGLSKTDKRAIFKAVCPEFKQPQ